MLRGVITAGLTDRFFGGGFVADIVRDIIGHCFDVGRGRLNLGARFDCCPQACASCTDDEHVVLVGLVLGFGHQKSLASWMAPVATMRM